MTQRYSILYRLGITPWEHDDAPKQLKNLNDEWASPARDALDIGCGTGAVYLAQHGWTVTGVDGVAQALDKARARAQARHVEVTWIQGDVCRLQELGIAQNHNFVLDRGCFHDFTNGQREQYARALNAVTGPDALLLMFAFQPRKRGLGPRGVSPDELTQSLGGQWKLLSSTPDTDVRLPRWLGDTRPTWYRLQRGG